MVASFQLEHVKSPATFSLDLSLLFHGLTAPRLPELLCFLCFLILHLATGLEGISALMRLNNHHHHIIKSFIALLVLLNAYVQISF